MQETPSEFVSTNPATGREIARYPTLRPPEIETALTTAATAFARWRVASFDDRGAILIEVARLLEADTQTLAALMSREMGKPFHQGRREVRKCAWVCRHYAEHAEAMLADVRVDSDAARSWIRYEPLGPVLAVMPWNFPLWQVFRFAAPALMAGNVALVKHAPSVGGIARAIEELWRRAGLPRGVYQDLPIDVARVADVIADARVRAVTLTGSGRAGRSVASLAGQHLKPAVLELGGSDPFIVLPSADLASAVDTAMRSRALNNGQSCIAAKRFIVHEAVADAFEEQLVAAFERLDVGDPMDEGVDVGPLATAAIRDTLAAQVDATVAAGARVLLGGKTPRGAGFYYPPTVLVDIPAGTPARDEELFGPVACLFRVDSLDAAIALANDTAFGLGASVWTHDDAERDAAIATIDAGCVFVNGIVKSDPRLPFGGIKDSGFGRELGRNGARAFTNVKTIWVG